MTAGIPAEAGYSAAPLNWLEHGGQMLALSRDSRRWAVLNPSAATILRACDGVNASKGTIRSRFEHAFGPVDPGHLDAWLADLERSGLLRRGGAPSGAAPGGEAGAPPLAPAADAAPATARYSVVHAYVELLARCNLRCVHCFMGGAPERREQLTLAEVRAVVDDLHAAGGRYVTLSGGEPVLHPDFAAIARLVSARGLSGTVISNGTTLKPEVMQLIEGLGFNLAISLDGVSDATNQAIRGTTAGRIVRVIDRALEVFGADRIILSFTPVKANLHEVEPLLDFVASRGIRRVNISVYEEVGRARDFADRLALDTDDRVRLMDVLFRRAVEMIGETEIDLNDTRNILSQFVPNLCDDTVHPLWRSVRVTSSGEVFPGSFGAVEQFRLGNIRETPFAGLIRNDRLADLRGRLEQRVARTPECSACAWRQICRGGSVAAAYCATGRIDAPDPHCAGYRAVFPKVAVALAERAGRTEARPDPRTGAVA